MVLRGFDVLKDNTTFPNKYKGQFITNIQNEMKANFEQVLKMTLTIKDRKNIANQVIFTQTELTAMEIL